jgi:hypothetical protein
VLLLRSGDITFGMGLYRRPNSAGSGRLFCYCTGRSWSHRIASTFLSRIDPAYLLAVADERHFNVDKGAGGDKERSKAFLLRLFYLSFGKEQPDASQGLPLHFLYIIAVSPPRD